MKHRYKRTVSEYEEYTEGCIRIRNLKEKDHQSLLNMYGSFYPKNYAFGLPPKSDDIRIKWINNLEHERLNVVAESGDSIAGHAAIIDVIDEDFCELLFFVHQDFRHMGIGSALVVEICKRAFCLGKKRIWLMVERENIAALTMLYNIGFRITRVNNVDYEMEMDLESMIKDLSI